MYNHICTQFTTFSFIPFKAKKPFSFDFNNKKRKRKRKREKACSCLFPIFFSPLLFKHNYIKFIEAYEKKTKY